MPAIDWVALLQSIGVESWLDRLKTRVGMMVGLSMGKAVCKLFTLTQGPLMTQAAGLRNFPLILR